jgi:hypothetical protein
MAYLIYFVKNKIKIVKFFMEVYKVIQLSRAATRLWEPWVGENSWAIHRGRCLKSGVGSGELLGSTFILGAQRILNHLFHSEPQPHLALPLQALQCLYLLEL